MPSQQVPDTIHEVLEKLTLLSKENVLNSDEYGKISSTLRSKLPPPPPPPTKSKQSGDIVKALYNFEPQHSEDLVLREGMQIEVIEQLSEYWWRGKVVGSSAAGVFPSNYVEKVSNGDSAPKQESKPQPSRADSGTPPPSYYGQASNHQSSDGPKPFNGQTFGEVSHEKQDYGAPPASWQQPPAPSWAGQAGPQQNSNYYPPPQQQYYYPPQQQPFPAQPQPQPQAQSQPQPQQSQSNSHHHHKLGNLGRRFGDSVMFGAGATLGSDMINKIF